MMLFDIDNFYSPLSKDGYLTPLQRKKLREKRKIDSCMAVEPVTISPKKNKKMRKSSDFKTKIAEKLQLKKRKYIKNRRRNSENKPQINFTASNLFPKKLDDVNDVKEKKFFKCRSPNHLEKAKFSMPLVLKRNLNLELDNSFKDQRKKTFQSSQSCRNIQEDSFSGSEFHGNSPVAKLETSECLTKLNATKITFFPTIITVRSLNANHETNEDFSPINSVNELSSVDSHVNEDFSPVNSVNESSVDSHVNEDFSESEVQTPKPIFEFDWPSDEILKERERKARLAFRKSLNTSLCTENKEEKSSSVKLFPVFQRSQLRKGESLEKKRSFKITPKRMLDTSKGNDQMVIDAGQKEIGAKVCSICSMVYEIGSAEDEKLHLRYHHAYITNLKFPGWKNENIIGEYFDGRVIKVTKDDKSFMLKKIQDILEIAHKDLGITTAGIPPRSDVVFVIFVSTEKQVAGCVVAEPIKSAYPVVLDESKINSEAQSQKVWKMENWFSSSKAVPALCGINRIWVASEFRRQKIASRMIDCLRCNFIYGHVVELKELAFTDPTIGGRDFAAAYTKTDNFLVYK